MKHDLEITRKLGDNPRIAPRFRRHQLALQDHDNVTDAVGQADDTTTHAGATASGDSRKLRGLPAIGTGVAGVITNAGELGALMAQRPNP